MSKLAFAFRYETTVTFESNEQVNLSMESMQAPRPVDAAEKMVRNEADAIARKLGAQVTDIYATEAKYGRADMSQPAVVYTFSVQVNPL